MTNLPSVRIARQLMNESTEVFISWARETGWTLETSDSAQWDEGPFAGLRRVVSGICPILTDKMTPNCCFIIPKSGIAGRAGCSINKLGFAFVVHAALS